MRASTAWPATVTFVQATAAIKNQAENERLRGSSEEVTSKMKALPGRYQQFKQEFPKISRVYDDIGRLTAEGGPLDEKLVQLIKLGMAVASGQEGAVHSHARRASEAGATREELRQVALLALTTVGFPRMMAGLTWIDDVLKGVAPKSRGARTTRAR